MAISFEEYVKLYYDGEYDLSKRYGIRKDDEMLSGTTGTRNVLFGAKVFSQLNTKSEIFKLLKKEPWTQSGWRTLTARHSTTLGAAESGAFPATEKPDLVEVTATLKEIVTAWETSSKAEILSEADDGLGNLAAFLRRENGEAHAYYLDNQLTTSVEADSDGTTGAGQAGNNLESLDRVTADSDYAADAQSPCNSQDDCDMYGLDITSATWFNAGYCHFTNDGSNNALALDDIDTGIATLLNNGLNYNDLILLTGHDSYQDLKGLMQAGTGAAWRYDLKGAGAANVNGVTGEAGLNFDSRVGSYDGIPIFVSQHIPSDGVSRIYMLDTSALAMRIAAPTTYIDNTNLAIRQSLSMEYAFLTAGELIAYRRDTSGSIRDLA
jgi:hypothetical protein